MLIMQDCNFTSPLCSFKMHFNDTENGVSGYGDLSLYAKEKGHFLMMEGSGALIFFRLTMQGDYRLTLGPTIIIPKLAICKTSYTVNVNFTL